MSSVLSNRQELKTVGYFTALITIREGAMSWRFSGTFCNATKKASSKGKSMAHCLPIDLDNLIVNDSRRYCGKVKSGFLHLASQTWYLPRR